MRLVKQLFILSCVLGIASAAWAQAGTPTCSPGSGAFLHSGYNTVTLTKHSGDSLTVYTTDGSAPVTNCSSGPCNAALHGTLYASPFTIGPSSANVRAVDGLSGQADGTILQCSYSYPQTATNPPTGSGLSGLAPLVELCFDTNPSDNVAYSCDGFPYSFGDCSSAQTIPCSAYQNGAIIQLEVSASNVGGMGYVSLSVAGGPAYKIQRQFPDASIGELLPGDLVADAPLTGSQLYLLEYEQGQTQPSYWLLLGGPLGNIYGGGATFNASGCSNSATVGGSLAGSYTSGTSGTCTVTVSTGLTAPHGYACSVWDVTTTSDAQKQTAFTTTSVTFSGTTVSGDVIAFGCQPF